MKSAVDLTQAIKTYVDDKDSSLKETLTNEVNVNGVKNVIPFPYSDGYAKSSNYGVSYTVDEDGAVIANGTSTGDSSFYLFTALKGSDIQYMNGMVLSGISDGDSSLFIAVFRNNSPYTSYAQAKTTGVVISGIPNDSTPVSCLIRVGNGKVVTNKKFYPMICRKDIYDADPTYEPYAKTNQLLTKETTGLIDNTELNGVVNMLPNEAVSQVINGITWTVNDDGTVTADGTATDNSMITICSDIRNIVPDGKIVKVSGMPDGGTAPDGSHKYGCRFRDGAGTLTYVENSEGYIGTLQTSTSTASSMFAIRIQAGITVSNLTFKPMITVADYDGDYVPYAKSNKKLTDNVDDLLTRLPGLRRIQAANIAKQSSKTLTFTNSDYCMGFISTGNTANIETMALLYFFAQNGKTTQVFELFKGNLITITTGTSTLTIANAHTGAVNLTMLTLAGEGIEFS